MSDALRGVVVCHGELAKALVEAAESISGVTGVLQPVSNSGCDRDALETRVAEAVGGRPAVVFVDLPSGSCLFAVLKRLRAHAGRQGRDRRQPRDAGGFRLPPLPHPRGRGGARASRPEPRRSGFPDGHRALSGGRPADPWTGGRGLGPSARRQPDRAGRRPGRGERLGAGPLPDGGDARCRGGVLHRCAMPRPGSGTGRRTCAAPWSSPATSIPWPRSTPPTR